MIGQSSFGFPTPTPPTGPGWRGRPPSVMQRYVAPSRVYMPAGAPPAVAVSARGGITHFTTPSYTPAPMTPIVQVAPNYQPAWRGDVQDRHRRAMREFEERRRLAMMTARIAAQQGTIQAQQAAITAQAQAAAAQQAAATAAAAANMPGPPPLPPLDPVVTQSPMPSPQADVQPSTETDVSPQQDAAADNAAANATLPEGGHKKLFIGLALIGLAGGGYYWYKKHKKPAPK